MMKKLLFLAAALLCSTPSVFSRTSAPSLRWRIVPADRPTIEWQVAEGDSHDDHIEMSGLRMTGVVRYGGAPDGSFRLNRNVVWPMLRTVPNNTHASLMRRFAWDPVSQIAVDGRNLEQERVRRIRLDGSLTVESDWRCGRDGLFALRRTLFPSVDAPAYCERYELTNRSERAAWVEIPAARATLRTAEERGVAGSYKITSELRSDTTLLLAPGASVSFGVVFSGRDAGTAPFELSIDEELAKRRARVAAFQENLILETPDSVINTMFAFAKIRAAESIYATQGGLMHGPGGESYYAAIWANDQAEYINPFFPFLGDGTGNRSALCSFTHFARFMNPDFRPIPSSIIAEGTDIWHGAGDRGDAAMIAYGAARYALARGDRAEAEQLWPLIEWCLEYCRRKLTADGVVASDSDELEGRFPAGEANLCTSSLYYDALLSASMLGRELHKPASQCADYRRRAATLRECIERHFGARVEGFDTYCYYEGNDRLRAWICIPLTVGIYDRSQGTVDALFSPALWTENGLLAQSGDRTFWDRATLYALRGSYACGETERTTAFLESYSARRLLGDHVPYAIEAWPEGSQRHLSAESGLYCRILTEGVFGIRPTGFRSFSLPQRLPARWDRMSLRRIRAFGSCFDLEVRRTPWGLEVRVLEEGKEPVRRTIRDGGTLNITLR